MIMVRPTLLLCGAANSCRIVPKHDKQGVWAKMHLILWLHYTGIDHQRLSCMTVPAGLESHVKIYIHTFSVMQLTPCSSH